MPELNENLRDLENGVLTREALALDISESAEHLIVGNGHMATNNFDVILNPAQFERSLDRAYIENIVKSIIDVVYDRGATEYELAYLSERLLEDIDNPDDIAALLLAEQGDIQGISSNSLNGLSGSEFLDQAFQNAYGRSPTPNELQDWVKSLDDGLISKAQLVASLAQSIEHKSVGVAHATTTVPSVATMDGTATSEALIGSNEQNDAINGLEGDDTLEGRDGSDVLTGGLGDDLLIGGQSAGEASNGNDTYVWSRGDGNDTIRDSSHSLTETDRLVLTDVASTEVSLSRNQGEDDLLITILPTGEVLTDLFRYNDITIGYGLEVIEFSDGVTWTLDNILANTRVEGTSGNDDVTGYQGGYDDNLYGLDGNDRLFGHDGDDTLTGGLGDDTLYGGRSAARSTNGNDTYVWSQGDGNDTIRDSSQSLTETDRLVLTDVASTEVSLSRNQGEDDLLITILPTGEVLTDLFRYNDIAIGYGLEVIEFSDGVTWTLDNILANTRVEGTSGNDDVTGYQGGYDDNLYGLDGNDRLFGHDGDDTLTGGLGDDTLYGGRSAARSANGNDTYVWSQGDGNDTIRDSSQSLTETDRLVLTDVASTEVSLSRNQGEDDLLITILPTGEVLTDELRYNNVTIGYGLEVIEFSDGVTWTLDNILSNTRVEGTTDADNLTGYNGGYDDNLYGLAGDDTLTGYDGNDMLGGGTGDDALSGGSGSDVFQFKDGFGSDTITDFEDGVDLIRVDIEGVSYNDIQITETGNNVELALEGHGTIKLENLNASLVSEEDFVFL